MRSITPELNDEDKELMEKIVAAGQVPHKQAVRLQVVLRRAAGKSVGETAESVGISRANVSVIVNRYNREGLAGLIGKKTRPPRIPPVSVEKKNAVCEAACKEKPADATHWSVRALAKKFGLGKSTINNILRERGIKPHLTQKFRFSGDQHFAEKLTDVVDLYINPPDNAIVLCVDEKSQIQALERSAPLLPPREKIPERQSADYYRHGTTTLFAALDMLTGHVIGECKSSHKSVDFIAFLKMLDKDCEKGKMLHVILDNYSVHKSKETKVYLEKNKKRFALHFIPTHSSWLNMIERWFAEITNKRIRRESWESVEQLVAAIKSFIARWNESGRVFKWTKSADTILDKINRSKAHYNIA